MDIMKWCKILMLGWEKRKRLKVFPESKKNKNIIANNSGSVHH